MNKNRVITDPGRKKIMMNQVAQYWNECIRLTDEEKVQASWEIEQLQAHVHQQRLKLDEANQKIGQEESQRQETKKQFEELQKEHLQVVSVNANLNEEIISIKSELQASKQRAASLNEKCRVYRAKLNETILEQQTLFKETKSFYDDSIYAIRAEGEKHASQTAMIDEALRVSRQKSDKLRAAVQDTRRELGNMSKLSKSPRPFQPSLDMI